MCQADHSSRGVLPGVVSSMCVTTKPCKGRPWPGIGSKRYRGEKLIYRVHAKYFICLSYTYIYIYIYIYIYMQPETLRVSSCTTHDT